MLKRSPIKRGRGNPIPTKIRSAVFLRSKGWCEVGDCPDRQGRPMPIEFRYSCAKATDMHHLIKRPRLHEPWAIVHLCRRHHEMCEGPYNKGRLVFVLPLPVATSIEWRIERRERKDGRVTELLGSGVIPL